jgi:hypothetical protein
VITWKRVGEASRDRAGHAQWYLCDTSYATGRSIVGEVVLQDPDGLQTYYAALFNGSAVKYFTDVEVAKAWLLALYTLEKASCN